MKYLKKFNEELRPQTYMSTAKKLDKLGHYDRADSLRDWADETEKKNEINKWREHIQDYAPFGTFKMTVKNIETGRTLTSDFHLDVNFDDMSFTDQPEGGITFFLGLIPTSEDLVNQYMKLCPDYEFSNGFFWGKVFSLQYELMDNVKFTNWDLSEYDDLVNGRVNFSDRLSANKFKNLLIQIFSKPELRYPSGYRDVDTLHEKLTNCILAENSFSSDYGFKLEDASDYIKTISPNLLYSTL